MNCFSLASDIARADEVDAYLASALAEERIKTSSLDSSSSSFIPKCCFMIALSFLGASQVGL